METRFAIQVIEADGRFCCKIYRVGKPGEILATIFTDFFDKIDDAARDAADKIVRTAWNGIQI